MYQLFSIGNDRHASHMKCNVGLYLEVLDDSETQENIVKYTYNKIHLIQVFYSQQLVFRHDQNRILYILDL